MDKDGARMILENIEEMSGRGTSVLATSVSFKDMILLGGKSYVLNENGLEMIEHDEPSSTLEPAVRRDDSAYTYLNTDSVTDAHPFYRVEKIPAKVNDRMLLFNPVEIDFIESEKGISSLSVRGEKFTCANTLNELENRLKHLGFFRCHRAYLVNLQRVREIVTWTRNSYSLILDDKNKSNIPLSKGRIDELKGILNL